ncbi:TonB-linked outer membrane protein, SusC/RagA family [Fodinibius sediminis]|uniref:TonB-linked outer membrane protein, SusC/RagA family n=2 Tax=Fodinibius sediminis TaxID=1214077 RepID=A0A521C1N4_9BACT|nr:TonB-linked outer membrane protein, SusC/RagA family [Fodinibius sediminis]
MFFLATAVVQAQDITVTGQVTDATSGQSLPGVNITVQGTTQGTSTNADGRYEITVASDATLVFSFVGFQRVEVPVEGQTSIDVVLQESTAALDEVVVVGFGTQRRADVTGAVSSVSADELEEQPLTNTELGLQGVSPGLTVQYQGGQPGEENTVTRIRGTGTLNNANPLILVDGVEQSLSTLEPSAIESITVLKDAASAAIYGSRAANGVILVTTKRGSRTGMTIKYNSHVGWQNMLGFPEPAGKEEWMRLENEAQVNAGGSPTYSEEYIQNVVAGTNPLQYPFAEWEEGSFKDNALEQNHSLSVSTGSDVGRIYANVNYTNADGVVQNFNNQRASIRINSDLFITDELTAKANLLYRNRDVTGPGFTPARIVQGILHMNRNAVMSYPDGQEATGDLLFGQWNPFIMANSGETTRLSNDIVGTVGLDYQITESISIEGDFTANITGTNETIFRESRNGMINYVTGEPVAASGWFGTNTLQEGRYSERELSQRLFLNYDEDLGSHSISGVVGYEEIFNSTEQVSAARANFFNNKLRSLSAGDAGNQRTCQSYNDAGSYTGSCYNFEWRLRSFFGRANYSYDDRYSLQANLRYDGSSRFGDGNRWGLYPSFSAGWRISSESFMEDVDAISNLRLRGSWGQLGNERIGLFQFMNTYNLNQPYQFNDNVVPGAAVTDAGNPSITWETTTMTNVGLDLGFMDDRIEVIAEYFWNYTDDILLDLPIPATIGVNPPTQNAAEVSNIGWEFQVNYHSVSRDDDSFQYTVGVNMSDVVNKIESLSGEGPFYPDKFTVWAEGHSINSLRGFTSPGLYRTQEDLEQYPARINPNAGIGDIIYKDLNGDGNLSQSLASDGGDQIIMGNEDPRYEFGINFNATYKGFDFGMFWQGVLEQYHTLDGALMEGPNWQNFIPNVMAEETFHPERNPDGTWPKVTAGNTWNLQESDFWIQDTKYIRLKNIQLGYKIPQPVVNSLRVYVSGTNMLTFTPTELFDPEIPRGRSQFFPHTKQLTVGLNVTF